MNWWHKVKDQKIVVVAGLVFAGIAALGTFLGAINSIAEFVGLGWFDGTDGWIASTYNQLTGWLALQVSLPAWAVLPVLALALVTVAQFAQSKLKQNHPTPVQIAAPTPMFNDAQLGVLNAIVRIHEDEPGGSTLEDIRLFTGFSRLVTEGAIDVLLDRGYVEWVSPINSSRRLRLTANGRGLMLSPEISSEYWNQ